MPQINRPRPLKVCHTRRPWIYPYKELGEHLGQGVGKFWHCEAWSQASWPAIKRVGLNQGGFYAS